MKALSRIALPFSFAFICVPSYATLVTTGSVTPAGLGPGDTVITTGVSVGTGTLESNSGTSLTLNTNPFLTIAPVATDTSSVTVTGSNVGTPSKLRLEGVSGSDGNGAFLTVGQNGSGTLNILGGAKVEIDALGASLNRMVAPYPAGFQVGRYAGSTGVINLSGAGSELSLDSDFALGRIGRYGDGEMNITNGATLSFSGINSDLNVSSDVFTPNSGNGVLNINTGGRVVGPVFLAVGGSQDGEGTLNIDGLSSSISLSGACTPDCPAGYSYPNQGAFLTVGANEGKGTVNITNGAKIIIDSSGTSGAVDTGFALGGSPIIGPMGDGTLNVDGAGSELRVRGNESFFAVGRLQSGTGALSITNGGKVIMENTDGQSRGYVGDRAGAEGLITIDGTGSVLDAGYRLGIGVDQVQAIAGKGKVTLSNGGKLLADYIHIDNGGTINGNGTLAGSTGPTQVRVIENGLIDTGLSTGVIVIEGDLILDGGSLLLEANSMADFDRIVVTGDAIFNTGVMDIILGFMPGPSDVLNFFDVQGTVTVLDTFGGISVVSAPGSGVPLGTDVTVMVGDHQYTASTQSVPEPMTLALVGLGLAGIGYKRKSLKTA